MNPTAITLRLQMQKSNTEEAAIAPLPSTTHIYMYTNVIPPPPGEHNLLSVYPSSQLAYLSQGLKLTRPRVVTVQFFFLPDIL